MTSVIKIHVPVLTQGLREFRSGLTQDKVQQVCLQVQQKRSH